MNATEPNPQIERNTQWLSQENRLACWNHLRYRSGLPDITLEQAAMLMCDRRIEKDIKEYLD